MDRRFSEDSHNGLRNVDRGVIAEVLCVGHTIPFAGHMGTTKTFDRIATQSLACEVYRKQENKVKDLLPQSSRTRKINDKIQQRVEKSLFSQSLLREINGKMH